MNGINDQAMMAEIIKELTTIKNTTEIISKKKLSLAKWIEAQRSQEAILDRLKVTKNLT